MTFIWNKCVRVHLSLEMETNEFTNCAINHFSVEFKMRQSLVIPPNPLYFETIVWSFYSYSTLNAQRVHVGIFIETIPKRLETKQCAVVDAHVDNSLSDHI